MIGMETQKQRLIKHKIYFTQKEYSRMSLSSDRKMWVELNEIFDVFNKFLINNEVNFDKRWIINDRPRG